MLGDHITIDLNCIIPHMQAITLIHLIINMRILCYSRDVNIGHFPILLVMVEFIIHQGSLYSLYE